MKSNLISKVENTIEKFNMTNKSEHLLVCLSGGADSTTLLLCLYKLGYDIEACHINHQLRGEESDSDEKFCVQLCNRLNIPITVRRLDVTGYCKKHSVSTEEGARILRYNVFDEFNADKICTAHSLSDCLETTLFNLARGTGLKGICSIPPVRENIIRPLIECTREEIEEYLEEENQLYVTDSTNNSDDYSRNKIRHNVVPQLKCINSSLMKSYADTLEFLREDNSFIEEYAKTAYQNVKTNDGINISKFNDLHSSIKSRVVIYLLKENDIHISQELISGIVNLALKGGKISVCCNTYAVANKNVLRISREAEDNQSASVKMNVNGETRWKDRIIISEVINYDGNIENVHKMFANCCLDYDKIRGEILLKDRKPNDKITLCNREFKSDIRKLVNKSFLLEQRNKVIILYDEIGAVYVEGYGVCDRVKITDETKNMLTFQLDKKCSNII